MASLTQPREGSGSKVALPSKPGSISFDSKRGKFVRYFPAVKDPTTGMTLEADRKVDINTPKFMVVAVNFFKVTGGQPQKGNPANFVGVSSPMIVTDKGAKWDQLVSVWVGNDTTPAYTGKWADIKEGVENKGGK